MIECGIINNGIKNAKSLKVGDTFYSEGKNYIIVLSQNNNVNILDILSGKLVNEGWTQSIETALYWAFANKGCVNLTNCKLNIEIKERIEIKYNEVK